MKLLTPAELIQFLPPEPELQTLAVKKFQKLISAHGSPPNWLNYAVTEGILELQQINFHEQPAFMVWFAVTPEGRLLVDSVQSVANESLLPVLAAGLDMLARSRGCKAIEFRTRRRGLIQETAQFGYCPTSIILTKVL